MTVLDCTTKRCPKCSQDLPTSEFWRNRSTHDGLDHNCKACRLAWKAANPDKVRAKNQRASTKWKAKNRSKCNAMSAVYRAIRQGKLPKQAECTCADCGTQAGHYHHGDYTKPLDVVPLCQACHTKRHYQEAH